MDLAPKVSALSLSSIRKKKELEQNFRGSIKDAVKLPTESFTHTELMLLWTKYSKKAGEKGQKIMESLLLMNDPKLEGSTIIHELPNESSKADFESGQMELLGYLRGKLNNHDIRIELVVNETLTERRAFTAIDRYNRMSEINPAIEVLKKTFDLDI